MHNVLEPIKETKVKKLLMNVHVRVKVNLKSSFMGRTTMGETHARMGNVNVCVTMTLRMEVAERKGSYIGNKLMNIICTPS